MKKTVILIAVIILVCACAVGCGKKAIEPSTSDNGEVSDIVTDPTDEITEPITDKPTEPVTEPVTEAPTEPVTEAPTEPEPATEPETVPPTQPKVDFTYIARDTMLDGEEVEHHNGCSYPEYFPLHTAYDDSPTPYLPFLLYEVNGLNTELYSYRTTRGFLNISVVTEHSEYKEFCEWFYKRHINRFSEEYLKMYGSYDEMPEYNIYDESFFKNNDLIILNSNITYTFGNFEKKGAELCLDIQSHMRGFPPDGNCWSDVSEEKVIRCFEISKEAMDGVDTISIYVENIEN